MSHKKYSVVALFRGINVGGHHLLAMSELKGILNALGLEQIKTYIQSGNVIFTTSENNLEVLAKKISTKIKTEKGFSPTLLLLTKKDYNSILNYNPLQDLTSDLKLLHIIFYCASLKKVDRDFLKTVQTPSEHIHIGKKACYLYAPEGIGRSKLFRNIDKILGILTTTRNLKTSLKMSQLLGD